MATSNRASVIIAHTREETGSQAIWRGQLIPKGANIGDYWLSSYAALYVLREAVDLPSRKVWHPIEGEEWTRFTRERVPAPMPVSYGDY